MLKVDAPDERQRRGRDSLDRLHVLRERLRLSRERSFT
jgi:hypothetical protein